MNKETRVAILIDISGSMGDKVIGSGYVSERAGALWSETIKALKKVHKGRGGQIYLHRILFHSRVEENKTIKLQDAKVVKHFRPRGGTAIGDAMGTAWESLRDFDNRAGNVANLVIVCTDGQEGGARLYDPERLREIVKRTTRNGSFTWVYLSCDPDSSNRDVSEHFGVAEENTHFYLSIPQLIQKGIVAGLEHYFQAREQGYQSVDEY